MKLSFGKHHWIAILLGIAVLVLVIPYIKNRKLGHFDFYHASQIPPKPVVQWAPMPSVSVQNPPLSNIVIPATIRAS